MYYNFGNTVVTIYKDMAHKRRHRPRHGARSRPSRARRRAHPAPQTRRLTPPGRPPPPVYGSGGFLSSSSWLARFSNLVSSSHRISDFRLSQRGFSIKPTVNRKTHTTLPPLAFRFAVSQQSPLTRSVNHWMADLGTSPDRR